MATPSVTSFAILGLLAIQPWSAYELKTFMETSALRTVWPRAASSIYREPKLLVEMGLATVERQRHRGPERSVYAISERGRAALAAWLATPGTSKRFEDEGLVRVLFAANGTKDQLLAQIDAMRRAAIASIAATGIDTIARTGFRFPERVHISSLVLRYGLEQAAATLRWCDWAEGEVSGWADDVRASDADRKRLAAQYQASSVRDFLVSAGVAPLPLTDDSSA